MVKLAIGILGSEPRSSDIGKVQRQWAIRLVNHYLPPEAQITEPEFHIFLDNQWITGITSAGYVTLPLASKTPPNPYSNDVQAFPR
jgi:hypothetical protein